MSLKRKSSTPSRSLKRISLSTDGKVKNSPIKEMNGVSLKELIKNDKKMDPKLRDDLNVITTTMESSEIKNQSFAKMEQRHYCHYLKTKITKKTMKKLFDVLLLKHKYSEKMDMDELCTILSKHRPDLMRPRVLNFILALINTVFNKTAITICCITMGIVAAVSYKDSGTGKFLRGNIGEPLAKWSVEFGNMITKEQNVFESYKPVSALLSGAVVGIGSATFYNLLRQVSFFMPKGYRLGNRIRARHSARKIIGDTRRNKDHINV